MNFLERLARALNMDEISNDIGVDLHTESLLLRAEQLARLESEKLVDKVRLLTLLVNLNKLGYYQATSRKGECYMKIKCCFMLLSCIF